jgi:hypothetical protein
MNCPECKSSNTESDLSRNHSDEFRTITEDYRNDCGAEWKMTEETEITKHGKRR